MLKSGATKTTSIDYINRNNQKVLGTNGREGTDHNQLSYKLKCLNVSCGYVYGANGSDLFQRKCPRCQGGRPSIEF